MSSLAGLAARLMPFQHHPLNKCFGSLSPGAPTPSTGAHCPRRQWLHAVPMFSTCRAAHVQKAVHRLLQLGHGLIAPISAAGRRGLSVMHRNPCRPVAKPALHSSSQGSRQRTWLSPWAASQRTCTKRTLVCHHGKRKSTGSLLAISSFHLEDCQTDLRD